MNTFGTSKEYLENDVTYMSRPIKINGKHYVIEGPKDKVQLYTKDNYITNQDIATAIESLNQLPVTAIDLVVPYVKITKGLTNGKIHHTQAGGNMYNKYLKYKNKYASLKKSSEI